MRIVIDLQGAQSTGSRNRGIGRYTTSFVQEFIRQKNADDEIIIVLNGLLVDSIKPIISDFYGLIPEENFKIWSSLPDVNHVDPNCATNRRIAESIRERFIANLNPDLILISSLFEGGDDSVVTVKKYSTKIPTAVILYDLIPYIYQDIYLTNDNSKKWYLDKIKELRRSDLLLAISESSGNEAINYLGFSSDEVINISTACHDHFTPGGRDYISNSIILNKFGLDGKFVMYTGGIDHRKNIEGLIEAYSLLPFDIKRTHKLAIVCKINEQVKLNLLKLAANLGIEENAIVLTGFVTETELVELYRACTLFVFPSWHEGFGLPALEAMACGKAVVGSNTSSVPEVLGREDILFDPYDTKDIMRKMLNILSNDFSRAELESYGLIRSKLFSWQNSAKIAWDAIRKKFGVLTPHFFPVTRKKLAILSPLPPVKSGISEYTVTLLDDLSSFYDIELILVDTESKYLSGFTCRDLEYFKTFHNSYERIVYHIGNSIFHAQILDICKKIPGVIVLHDFFLSGALHALEEIYQKKGLWSDEILDAHGYGALKTRTCVDTWLKALDNFPSNYSYLQASVGVIAHSDYSRDLAIKFYKNDIYRNFRISPMVRKLKNCKLSKTEARKNLGFKDSDFIICSFGLIHHTKCNKEIVEAISKSILSKMDNAKLVIVGECPNAVYKNELLTQIRAVNGNIKIEITGWVSEDIYEQFLKATDIAVQLRIKSRGETSAAIHDTLLYGIPTIVNDYASFSSLSEQEVIKIPADFTIEELRDAIELIYGNSNLQHKISDFLSNKYTKLLSPRNCSNIFYNNIEDCYRVYEQGLGGLFGDLPNLTHGLDNNHKIDLVRHIESNFYTKANPKDFWILSKDSESKFINDLVDYYVDNSSLDSLEVAFSGECFSYADDLMHRALSLPKFSNERGVVNFSQFDRVIIVASEISFTSFSLSFESLLFALSHNVKVYLYIDDVKFLDDIFGLIVNDDTLFNMFKRVVSLFDKLLFSSDDCLSSFYSFNECLGLRDELIPVSAFVEKADKYTASAVIRAITSNRDDFKLRNPKSLMYFTGSDKRFSTQVGERSGRSIFTKAEQGFLLFGPYVSLNAGLYDINISIYCSQLNDSDFLDVACDGGRLQLAHLLLNEELSQDVSFLKLSVDLDHAISDLEIRIYCSSESIIRIDEIIIQRKAPNIEEENHIPSLNVDEVTQPVLQSDIIGSVLSTASPVKKPFHGNKTKPNKRRKR